MDDTQRNLILEWLKYIIGILLVGLLPGWVNRRINKANTNNTDADTNKKVAETAQILNDAAEKAVEFYRTRIEDMEAKMITSMNKYDELVEREREQDKKMDALEKENKKLKKQQENLAREFNKLRDIEYRTRMERDAYRKQLLEAKIEPATVPR